jgi:RHS repeat-associated protein
VVSKTDPDGRTTRYQYDDRDRITYEIAEDPKLPADQALALGVGQLHYMYDGATPQDQSGEPLANRLGRLAGVEMFAAGQSAPYAAVRYGYAAQGHEAFTAWQLQVGPAQYTPGINASFQAVRSFDSQGRITSATYSTSIPQLAPTTVSWSYGGRGLLDEVRGNGLQLAKYGYTLVGPPRLRYAANSGQPFQFHSYVYDVRGRLTADLFSVNANSLNRTYAYSNAGDVTSVGIDDSLPDRPRLQAQMNVTTDGLHRIVSASLASSALPYAATLSYWPSGSIKTAGVQLPSSAPQPSRPAGTTYAYGTGVAADVQAVTALTAGTSTLARFTYDASGNMTRRDLGGLPSGSVTDFLYDPNGQARRAANGNGTEQYYYDHTRRRFLTVSNTAQFPFYRFHLGDEFELQVFSTFGTTQFRVNVLGNGEAIARLYQCWGCFSNVQPTMLLHHDRRGDLLAAIGIDGSLWAHNIYGAFGEHLYKPASAAPEPFRERFNGKTQDDIDGLSYYGHRFYDPVIFQWTTGDPLYRFAPDFTSGSIQRLNIYSFSLNNPLVYRDLNGLWDLGYEVLLASQHGQNNFDQYFDYMPLETVWANKGRWGRAIGLSGQYLKLWMQADSEAAQLGVLCASIGGCGPAWDSADAAQPSLAGPGIPVWAYRPGPVKGDEHFEAKLFLGAIGVYLGIGALAEFLPVLGASAWSWFGPKAVAVSGPAVVALGAAGGKLAAVLDAIKAEFGAVNPKTALEAMRVIQRATESVGLEPGYAQLAANGQIILQNAKGVTTTLGVDGSILVQRGSEILLHLVP